MTQRGFERIERLAFVKPPFIGEDLLIELREASIVGAILARGLNIVRSRNHQESFGIDAEIAAFEEVVGEPADEADARAKLSSVASAVTLPQTTR